MAAATTSLSKQEPDFTFKAQPPLGKRKKVSNSEDKNAPAPAAPPIPEQPEQQQQQQGSSAQSEMNKDADAALQEATPYQQDAAKENQPNNNGVGLARPQGKLSIVVIEGRNLAVSSSEASPYVVAVYDSNEFVGREPITETDAPVTSYVGKSGAQTPLASHSNGTSSPAGGSLSSTTAQSALQKSLEQHRKQQEAKSLSPPSPSTSAPANKSQSKASDPLWKQEVVLCALSL